MRARRLHSTNTAPRPPQKPQQSLLHKHRPRNSSKPPRQRKDNPMNTLKWFAEDSFVFTDYHLYRLEGLHYARTDVFIAKPKTSAHAAAIGLPHGYRYNVYISGAHPSGCALPVGMFKTLK